MIKNIKYIKYICKNDNFMTIMKLLNLVFFIWRGWLWVSVMLGLILFSPLGVILISFQKTYPLFHMFCRYWCRFVLLINGFWYVLRKSSKIDFRKSYIICPNHTSKFDIILLFATFPKTFVFIGKKNVSNIWLFEWFYNKTMITFERGSVASSFSAYRKADKLLKSGTSIVIFPEGQVPSCNIKLGDFKLGAFKLAINNKVPILPVTFLDNKRKYPEDKLSLTLGSLRVVLHDPIETVKLDLKNSQWLRDSTYNIINTTLIQYEN